jgi:hypothetical protein
LSKREVSKWQREVYEKNSNTVLWELPHYAKQHPTVSTTTLHSAGIRTNIPTVCTYVALSRPQTANNLLQVTEMNSMSPNDNTF